MASQVVKSVGRRAALIQRLQFVCYFGRLRAIFIAGLLLGTWSPSQGPAHAQEALPPDIAQPLAALVQKLKTLRDDRSKLDPAIKQLDADVGPLRNKDDYAKSIAVELTKWIGNLSAEEGKGVRADKTFQDLFTAADQVRDSDDFVRATRLAEELQKTLAAGRFKLAEKDTLATTLAALSVETEKFIKDQPLRIHIISAKYGVQGTARTCDATGYFRAKCEGQPKCPAKLNDSTEPAPIPITGAELCNSEPAPLAEPHRRVARVKYKCIRFGLRPWADIEKNERDGAPVDLVGKGQITCDFR